MKLLKTLASSLALSGIIAAVGVPAVSAQTDKNQLTQFLNQVTQINKTQEALAGQAITNAGYDMPLKTLANTIKWNDVANQEAVEAIASKQHVNLNGNANIPKPDANLLHMTGDQFAKAYIATEIRDQSNALKAYQNAEKKFHNNPNVELYIEQSIPVVQTH